MTWLIGALAATSIGLAALTFQATATAASLSSEAATTAIRHKKAISTALAKAKAKARLKRTLTMIPVVGAVIGAYFEKQEYEEWVEEHPEGSKQEYLCEVATLTSEVLDEVLFELPQTIRPSRTVLSGNMPKCNKVDG